MIFLLEDEPERAAWFETRFPGELLAARTVEAGLRLLEERGTQVLDAAFLDHDLELAHPRGEFNSDMHTGQAFVDRVLCDEHRHPGLRKAGKVVIHSMNPEGAFRMHWALHVAGIDAEIIPYYQLKKRMSL